MSHVLSEARGTVDAVTETLCTDCQGALAVVVVDDAVDDTPTPGADLDLMCVLCGAALSLGGLLLGEAEAWAELVAEDRGAA